MASLVPRRSRGLTVLVDLNKQRQRTCANKNEINRILIRSSDTVPFRTRYRADHEEIQRGMCRNCL